MAQQIQLRHDTAANWTSANPTLMVAEMGIETDTARFKIGDGSTAWTSLSYASTLSNPMTTAGDLIYGGTSGAATRLANGSAGQVLQSAGGTAAPTWASSATNNASTLLQNLGLAVSVASNAMTIALKQSDGSTAPAAAPNDVKIGMRSSTATTGGFNLRSVAAALSIVIPSGATLGQTSAVNQYVWVYALDNAGTVELAVSGVSVFADNSIQSSTTISSGATSGSTLYSTTGRSNVPIRLIGRLLVNETTAGTWAANTTDIVLAPRPVPNIADWVNATATIGTSNWGGFGTPTIHGYYWKRDGDSITVSGHIQSGTVAGSAASIPLPSVAIDASKVYAAATGPQDTMGGQWSSDGGNQSGNISIATTASTTVVYCGLTSAGSITPATGTAVVGSASALTFRFTVPIAGWSTYGP